VPIDGTALTASLSEHGSSMVPMSELAMKTFLGDDPLVLTDDHAPVDQLLTTVR
jgi:hypothetical protein